MKLIGRTISPFTRRVAVAMTLWDMPFEIEPIPSAEQARLRKFNPVGRVPALVLDDGEILIDSLAIIDTLAEMAGHGQHILPASGPERRCVLQANALVTGAIEKVVAAFYEGTQKAEGKRDEAWQARLFDQARSGLAALEERARQPWLCGEGPSIADITVATSFDFIAFAVSAEVDLAQYPKLQEIAEKVRSMPAYQSTAPEA